MDTTAICYVIVATMMFYNVFAAFTKKDYLGSRAAGKYTEESMVQFVKYYVISCVLCGAFFVFLALTAMDMIPDFFNFTSKSIPSLLIRLAVILVLLLPMMYGNFAVLKKTGKTKEEKESEDEDF